jgi:hypothetical protein
MGCADVPTIVPDGNGGIIQTQVIPLVIIKIPVIEL